MPLRDHFRPPVSKRSSWEGLHGGWPMRIVEDFAPHLPPGYVAEPRVHLGKFYEIDVCTFETDEEQSDEAEAVFNSTRDPSVGLATAPQAPPAPTLTLDAEFPDEYSYEVLIFDLERERQLVAAIEIVSPANKDRPESRRLFAAKCLNLLKKNVCVSIVDLVTIRKFSLYTELLSLINRRDPAFESANPSTYAVTCRKRGEERGAKLDIWSRLLVVGEPLPTLPIWLTETLKLDVDLEASYEETCRVLRIA